MVTQSKQIILELSTSLQNEKLAADQRLEGLFKQRELLDCENEKHKHMLAFYSKELDMSRQQ